MLRLLAEQTVTLEIGAMITLLGSAATFGAMRVLGFRRRNPGGANGKPKCEDHDQRLLRLETQREIELPNLQASVDKLSEDMRAGFRVVHRRLDELKAVR